MSEPEGTAHLFFLPSVREGLAGMIGADATGARASINLRLTIGARAVGSSTVVEQPAILRAASLFGPGDVIAIDPRAIVRTDPRPNVLDFESNMWPCVDFVDADFPWRYTAAAPTAAGALKPWITLVVLVAESREQLTPEFVELPHVDRELPARIQVDKSVLPDLTQASRWAHVQVTAASALEALDDGALRTKLAALIRNDPERAVSRLVCARRLHPRTLYRAFIVPTFELGRRTGLGETADPGTTALTPAWSGAGEVVLPYYYSWTFRSAEEGDFEALVRRLNSARLTGIGIRDMNVGDPGFGVTAVERPAGAGETTSILQLEGALTSLDFSPTPWGKDDPTSAGAATGFQTDLASSLLNLEVSNLDRTAEAAAGAPSPQAPVIGPPVYGRWHSGRKQVRTGAAERAWVDVLNLDPRHRSAASFGTRVVKERQEELMASAWAQLGRVRDANAILRRAQLGREVGAHIHERLDALEEENFLRVAEPLHARTLVTTVEDGTVVRKTLRHVVRESALGSAWFDPALRRITRPRGALRKRQRAGALAADVLDRLDRGALRPAGPHPEPDGMPSVCDVTASLPNPTGAIPPQLEEVDPGSILDAMATDSPLTNLITTTVPAIGVGLAALGGTLGLTVPGSIGRPSGPRPGVELPPPVTQFAGPFCGDDISGSVVRNMPGIDADPAVVAAGVDDPRLAQRVADALDGWLNAQVAAPATPPALDPSARATELRSLVDPEVTVVARARTRVVLADDVPARSDNLDDVLAAPEFPQPMYEGLRDISQQLLAPGIDKVPPNSVGLLKTNDRFVESYMVGLNHELAAELLWREYPTDQRGSYFRQFWDVSEYEPTDTALEKLREEADAAIPSDAPDRQTQIDAWTDEVIAERLKDVDRLHLWGNRALGENDNRAASGTDNKVVLVIRGDLLRRYPNTVIYAVDAVTDDDSGKTVPALSECVGDAVPKDSRFAPVFHGVMAPDIRFYGFDFSDTDARSGGSTKPLGIYFVIEERVSETRFGLDEASGAVARIDNWDQLTWSHVRPAAGDAFAALPAGAYVDARTPDDSAVTVTPKWNAGSAAIARATFQKPFRVAIHADRLVAEQ